MNRSNFYQKWYSEVISLSRKKDFIPEIDVKAMLKERSFEIAIDIDAVFQETEEKLSLCIFVADMIDHGISEARSVPVFTGYYDTRKRNRPGLDYYDNRRDFGPDGPYKYRAGFGIWNSDN